MRIKNTSGQFWTGKCWGVEQAAEEYMTVDDLPEDCDGADLEDHGGGDIRYYMGDSDDALASVV